MSDLILMALIFLDVDVEKHWQATKTSQNFTQSLSAHSIKYFSHVDECYVQSFAVTLTPLFELSEHKHFVCIATLYPEDTLAFWDVVLSE